MSDRSGCLLALLGGGLAPKRLGSGLPRLDLARVHAEDRVAVQKAQRAAEAADAAFSRPGVPDVAVADLAAQLALMIGVLHRLAERLNDARNYVASNDPDKLARERTDLEMRRLGASAAEILALRTAGDALTKRSRVAEQIRDEISTLEARLLAAGHDLEAFRAKVTAGPSAADLGGELAEAIRNAEQVLEAHERTRREMRG